MHIFLSHHFKKQLRTLKKKYPHVDEDFLGMLDELDFNKETHLGKSIYKVRVRSTDQNKGKSGGFRSYIYFYVKKNITVPLCIHPKNEVETLTENQIQHHFAKINKELIDLLR